MAATFKNKQVVKVKNMLNLKKWPKKAGLPPGSLVYTGKKDIPTKINIIEYNKEIFS